MTVLIDKHEALALEQWLGVLLFRKLVQEQRRPVFDQRPPERFGLERTPLRAMADGYLSVQVAPDWLVLVHQSRREVMRAAMEDAISFHLTPGVTAPQIVAIAQHALLDLVERAASDHDLSEAAEALVRLSGGKGVYALIRDRCRDRDIIERAAQDRYFPPT